jgi:tricorn protease
MGGLASDVLVFNLKNQTVENITKTPFTEGKPAWCKNKIYYVSDAGSNRRRNIWVYDKEKSTKEQVTTFEDVDINSMSAGPDDLVFEAGGRLYTLSLANNKYAEVKINVVTDESTLMPRTVNVSNNITNYDISPDAKRAVFEARGELFSLPAEYGVIINLTNTSGAFDRLPAWSPNGKWLAYWSDESGEFEIYLREVNAGTPAKKLTSIGKGMGWQLFWSPDSKKIAFIDEKQSINLLNVSTGEIESIDKTTKNTYTSLEGFEVSWSPDSKWLAYSKTLVNLNDAIFMYSLEQKKGFQATSGYYNDTRPVFDATGKYLFFATDRSFSPSYSNLDGTWIYPNNTLIAFATLDPNTQSILYARNDDVKVVDTSSAATANKAPADTTKKPKPAAVAGAKVLPENIESRIEILPLPPGNYGSLYAADGKLIYQRFPNTGAGAGLSAAIYIYDFDKREEKTLLANAQGFVISHDGKSMLARDQRGFGIVKLNPDQKIDKVLPTADMEMILHPREEWKEIFNDTWRRYRDFFYDPSMHKVDWDAIRKQYGALVDNAITRWDVNNIQQEMISELSAGHTFAGGGDLEQGKNRTDGFLGIDWAMDNHAYKIKRIVRGGKWDNEVRSPFDNTGVNVKEGDYILSVNGRPLEENVDPYAPFEGLAGKAVALRVNDKPSLEGSRTVVIKTLTPREEARLRNLEWIEQNRKKVEELSGGKLGYMYMPDTGVPGQTELLRQFYAQIDKEGFVIDERFNAGGQLADRFIEMLNRPVLYNISWRNADVTVWPVKGNNAPKVMLINGWAGSGGDAFPWAFQQLKLGPIVGERTLGILVGPATGHALIDGGFISVPDARLYGADGKWFAEGVGIKPEIEVWDDPAQLAKGNDPQLVRAVDEAMKLVKTNPRVLHPRPPFEDRRAQALKGF